MLLILARAPARLAPARQARAATAAQITTEAPFMAAAVVAARTLQATAKCRGLMDAAAMDWYQRSLAHPYLAAAVVAAADLVVVA
jgi:hypothetical protein